MLLSPVLCPCSPSPRPAQARLVELSATLEQCRSCSGAVLTCSKHQGKVQGEGTEKHTLKRCVSLLCKPWTSNQTKTVADHSEMRRATMPQSGKYERTKINLDTYAAAVRPGA